MNTLKRSFGFRMIKGLAEFSKLKRAVTCFIIILMRNLFIVKQENIAVFISSTDVTEWIWLLIKTDLLKVCQSPFWKDRPLSALIEKLVNRPSIQGRPFPSWISVNIVEDWAGLLGETSIDKDCKSFSEFGVSFATERNILWYF